MAPDDSVVFLLSRETDGRWIAEVSEHPGVMAYGKTKGEALCVAAELLRLVLMEKEDKHGQV